MATTKFSKQQLPDFSEVDLTGYATEAWVEGKGYLTSVPSEYATES